MVVLPYVPEPPPTRPAEPTHKTSPPLPRRFPFPSLPIFDPKLPPIDMPLPSPANPTDFPRGGTPSNLATDRGELGADSAATFRS